MLEKLKADRAHLEGLVRKYSALLHSNEGALKYVNHLIEIAEGKDSLSAEEFAKMVAGEGATAEIIKNDSSGTNQKSVS